MTRAYGNRRPTHPGCYLRMMTFPHVQMNQAQIADRIAVSKNTISLLCKGELRLSVELAAKLGRLLDFDPMPLLQMQTRFDLWELARSDDVLKIEPVEV